MAVGYSDTARTPTRCGDGRRPNPFRQTGQIARETAEQSDVRSVAEGARRRRQSGVALMLAVLVLGAGGAWGCATAVRNAQRNVLAEAVTHEAADINTSLAGEVSDYQEALEDLAAALATQRPLTASAFDGMAANMTPDRMPGATGVAFIVPVAAGDVAGAQATWRAHGATGLVLKPAFPDQPHEFVIFGRAIADRPPVPGRDAAASPDAADTLRIARESRAFTLSRAHVLLRDKALPSSRRQQSFTMAAPVFDRPVPADDTPVRGWVVMGVRGDDFLDHVLADQTSSKVEVSVVDPAAGDAVLATYRDGSPLRDRSLVREATLAVGQHTWHVTVRPTAQRLSAGDRWGALVTLLTGLAITLLLVAFVGVLATARNRALDRVDLATAALREDIRRREAVEQELQWLAYHDQLTGLANRGLFYDRVGQALRSHLRTGRVFAVFFLDLDGFKQVNDGYGHGAGDHVLREVAERLRTCLRESDTTARFGGDEFAAILESLSEPGDVHATAERVIAAIEQPIDIGGREVVVSASIGIALNRPGDTADDMMRAADMAMYTAKTGGKSRHVVAGDAARAPTTQPR